MVSCRKEQSLIGYLRLWVAVWAGRLIGWISRVRGNGGSSLPGLMARRIYPRVLSGLAHNLAEGTVLITGTNGKTTTAQMASRILAATNWRVVTNRSGANLIAGLTTTMLNSDRANLAVLETDEATMPRAAQELTPRAIVVTNVFRDQLDRYGELSTTLRYIQLGIERLHDQGQIILNADDPQVAFLGVGRERVVYFGLQLSDTDPSEFIQAGIDDVSDSKRCPNCGSALLYSRSFYAHLGLYRCGQCEFTRPTPALTVQPNADDRQQATILGDFAPITVAVPLPGRYNLYNLAAASALAWSLGVSPQAIPETLAGLTPAFGRMESIVLGDCRLWIALVKNPVGFDQVITTIIDAPEPSTVLIIINDRYADGTDVSWLWDVDFEIPKLRTAIRHWWVSGLRAWDMAVRLKYAGVSIDAVTIVPSVPEALTRAQSAASGGTLYVLPTYTALLELRQILTRQGVVKHFREG